VTLGALALAVPANAAVTLPSGFQRTTILGGLSRPAAVAWTPDGRMLIAMRDGQLKVLKTDGTVVTPYSVLTNTYSDHGFLGVAVDANYASNHYAYLLYTYENDANDYAGTKVSVLERIQLSATNVASDSQIILGQKRADGSCPAPSNTNNCIPSESDSHSIGTVRADPDGTLWVGSGDAADFGGVAPAAFRSYDESSYAGKILHIDRNGRGLTGHSFCPADTDLTHICAKVYAKGFRNPFRFTLRGAGQGPVVGDVGWNSWEELDLVDQGKDYGWPCWEGHVKTAGYSDDPRCSGPGGEYSKPTVLPSYDFPHSSTGMAVVGGPTYKGTLYPGSYRSSIFLGAYGVGYLRQFDPASGTATDFGSGAYGWIDLDTAPDNGDLVYVDFGDASDGTGSVGRISYTAANRVPVAVAGASTPTAGPTPLTVGFRGGQSSDPDGDSLRYDWDFGDGTPHSSAANPSHQYTTRGRYTARLTVDDQRGGTASATVVVNAGAPTVTIATPIDDSLYTDGTPVPLQGSATDATGQPVPGSGLSWRVRLHHNTHVHDIGTFPGAGTSFTPLVNHDADSYYEVTLNATDANGVTGSRLVTIRPQTVRFMLASEPPGAQVSYGGTNQTAPFVASAAVGYETSISATDQFSSDGTAYTFSQWSDGGSRLHSVTIPSADTTLTAGYTAPSTPPAFLPPAGTSMPPAGPSVPAAGTTVTATGTSVTAVPKDRTAPTVTLTLRRRDLRRGLMNGLASDASSIRIVEVALRSRTKPHGTCRWWSPRRRRLRSPSSCAPPRWIRARLSAVGAVPRTRRWTVNLQGRLPPGRYVLLLHAVDGSGNSTYRIGTATEIAVKT
jgi:glucose/arabinose dehydrogenase/PKD repeat protein